MSNYVYCIVDEDGIIQKGTGSSNRTKYFEKPIQPQKWCDYNNKVHNTKWRVARFELVETGNCDDCTTCQDYFRCKKHCDLDIIHLYNKMEDFLKLKE